MSGVDGPRPAELQRAWKRLSADDGLHGLLARIAGEEARDARLPKPADLASVGVHGRHRASLAEGTDPTVGTRPTEHPAPSDGPELTAPT